MVEPGSYALCKKQSIANHYVRLIIILLDHQPAKKQSLSQLRDDGSQFVMIFDKLIKSFLDCSYAAPCNAVILRAILYNSSHFNPNLSKII